MKIEFQIVGRAIPAGSKQAIPVHNRHTGEVLRGPGGRIVTRTIHDNPKLADWLREVGYAARQAYDGALLEGPIRLEVIVFRVRPKRHYRTGRNSALLRDGAPVAPDTKPDLTKLVRGIEDGLTGVIWRDDSQVCSLVADKRWGRFNEVHVVVSNNGKGQHSELRSPKGAQAE